MIIQQLITSIIALMAGFLLMMLALYCAGYKKKSSHKTQPLENRNKKCGSCTDCTCGSVPQN